MTTLKQNTRASTTVEAALVLAILLPMLLGGLQIGLAMWTKTTLQSVASMTARCVAIKSTACANSQLYAANLAANWLGSGMIGAANVTVTGATECNGASGNFQVVTISASPWAGSLIYPFTMQTQTLSACYPT